MTKKSDSPGNAAQGAAASDIINQKEFLRRVPICRRTLKSWRDQGIIPWIDVNGRVLFHWPSAEAALLRKQRGVAL